jgi:hypothetical protein
MKKGMILYIREESDETFSQEMEDLIEVSRSLGVSAVSLAFEGEDIISGWVHLIAGGVNEVLFMTVAYDVIRGNFETRGGVLKLCG